MFTHFNYCRPLGPFVPAPPEVAMQMLRDQGGPPPYDGGGRNMRSGPHIGGPAPIIAVPPAFRQDPRKMRRCVQIQLMCIFRLLVFNYVGLYRNVIRFIYMYIY